MQPHRGTLILILAVIGFFTGLGIILGPIAWVMGTNDLKKIDAGQMDPAGRGTTLAGKIIGMVLTILSVIGCFFFCVAIVIALGLPGIQRVRTGRTMSTLPPEGLQAIVAVDKAIGTETALATNAKRGRDGRNSFLLGLVDNNSK